MQVFCHHLYEYRKGLRNLILHTTDRTLEPLIKERLIKNNIPYLITYISDTKMNVFFGHEHCIEVIRHFSNDRLEDISDEEDFILGIMLGYDRIQQCRRFLTRKIRNGEIEALVG